MLLKDRCECMLVNHTQCPNPKKDGYNRCKLHMLTLLGTKNTIEDFKEQ